MESFALRSPTLFHPPRPQISAIHHLQLTPFPTSLSCTPKPPRRPSSTVCLSSAADKSNSTAAVDSGSSGAKPMPLVISVAVGLALRFLIPRPAEIASQAWQLLAIFLSTIAGLVLGPLPVGAWAFAGLTASVVTRTLSFSAAFSTFINEETAEKRSISHAVIIKGEEEVSREMVEEEVGHWTESFQNVITAFVQY